MSEEPDYKEKYLEERFNGIARLVNGQFINVNEKLEAIHEQTTKTNSRVTHLEEKVQDLELANKDHIINCPLQKEVSEIKDSMIWYKWISKNPGKAITIISFVVMITILGWLGAFSKNKILKQIKLTTQQEQVEIENLQKK